MKLTKGVPENNSLSRLLIVAVMIAISLLKPQTKEDKTKHVEIDLHMLKVSPAFIAGLIIIIWILAGLYSTFGRISIVKF